MKDNDDEIPAEIRPLMFAGVELLLDLIYAAQSYYKDIDLESLLIVLCVSDATMRPFVLDPTLDPAIMRAAYPPDDIRGAISRRMIADKTGLPRETVRRKTQALADLGHVVIDADDRVRAPSMLNEPEAQRAPAEVRKAVQRYLERLRGFGVSER